MTIKISIHLNIENKGIANIKNIINFFVYILIF